MADITMDAVVEYISNLSLLDASKLVKTLEEKLGVSAATPVAEIGRASCRERV